MKIEVLVEQFLSESVPPQILLTPLSEEVAAEVVDRLKSEADRYWAFDPSRSIEYANRIVAIGEVRGDRSQTALGLMARGNALQLLGRPEEAWETFEEAGRIFQTLGDQVRWARTRIGRMYLSTMVNQVPEALADAKVAREIFTDHGDYELLLRLDISTAFVYASLGDQVQALRFFQSALAIAETLGEAGKQYLGLLYMDIGVAHEALGDFSQALANYERARAIYIADGTGDRFREASILRNIGVSYQKLGEPRRAIEFLIQALQIMRETGEHVGEENILDYLAGEYRIDEKNQGAQGASDVYELSGTKVPSIKLGKKFPTDTQRIQVNGQLSPQFLKESVAAFLKAVSDLQHIIDELQNKPASEITIYSMNTEWDELSKTFREDKG